MTELKYYEVVPQIDNILKADFSNEAALRLFAIIESNAALENYFFKNVSDKMWFYPLKQRGYFNPDKAPGLQPAKQEGYIIIPVWNVLPYLEKVSQQVDKPGNDKYINELLNIIKEVSTYKNKSGEHIDNYHTWRYFVNMLLNIPTNKITEEILNLIPIWLDSILDTTIPGADITDKLLPRFLSGGATPGDIKKAEIIIKHITTYKKIALNGERAKLLGKKEEEKLVIDSFWLKEAFKKYSDVIGQRCSNKVIEDLEDKIKSLLRKKEDGTSASLYYEPEYSIHDPLEMLIFIIKKIMLVKAKTDVEKSKKILRYYLQAKHLIFPKLALYIIGQNSDNFMQLFWEVLGTDIGILILEETYYFGDELKRLLNNLRELSEEQRAKLDAEIVRAAEHLNFKEENWKYMAHHKQKIYQALSHDEYFNARYMEMKEITAVDTELRAAVGIVDVSSGRGASPILKEDILQMTNEELAIFLSTYKTEDIWKGPSVGGLAEILGQVARERPEKFTENIWPYKDSGFIYIYEIIDGIKSSWNEKKAVDWAMILDFAEQYANRQEFWDNKFIVKEGVWPEGADHEWVAGIVAELIQDGTRDDAWAFPEKHLEKAKEIIFLLLDKLKIEEEKEITDYVMHALNTPIGKTVMAFILLALRIARINKKKGILKEFKWAPDYREKYKEILDKRIIEGFTCLGRFMPNLYYLDKEWVRDKIEYLNKENINKYWEAFMAGYLSIGHVYDELYALMRPHYQRGIEHDFKEKGDTERLVQHIALSYLRGNEPFSGADSLFWKILDKFKYEQIEEIISLLMMQKGYIQAKNDKSENIRKKIIDFLRWLYERYQDSTTLNENDEKILSALVKLTDVLPKIDEENSKWLMLSASHVFRGFNLHYLIEYLDELKERGDNKETAKYICKIYQEILKQNIPDYNEKHIRSIVEFLYNSGAVDCARDICNIYGQNGYEFLRDIYEKYN